MLMMLVEWLEGEFQQHHQNEQLPLPSNNSTNIIKMNSYPHTIPPTSSK
jgi:hypothetical protein